MEHGPRGLLRAEAQHPLQAERRDAVLLAGQVPGGEEPGGERRPRGVEDRARGGRHEPRAAGARPAPIGRPPAAPGAAGRADDALGPAQPGEVVEAGCLDREPAQQLGVGARVVSAALRDLTRHLGILLYRSGGPTPPLAPERVRSSAREPMSVPSQGQGVDSSDASPCVSRQELEVAFTHGM